jgi:putative ABC transport system permease protein
MATFLAGRNLAHNKIRTAVAIAGVCFAVTLLFMQLGFFASVSHTAVLVFDSLDFDIVLTSPHYVMLSQGGTISRRRLYQAGANPDVAKVMPLYVNRQLWRNPQTRYFRSVVVLGIDPNDPIIRNPEIQAQQAGLARQDTVLIDRLSRPEVGPQDTGLVTEVGPVNLEIIGQFTIGPGFEVGIIVVSDQTFSRLLGGWPLNDVSLGLIKLRPGADPERIAEQLRQSLPPDVRVLTRPQLEAKEQHYWVVNTSTGIIFGSGVIVALLFGIVIIYQVLSLEVTNRLPEYATLKAMGYNNSYLYLVVLQQAAILAVLSFIPGYALGLGIYELSGRVTKLPISMTFARVVGVFILTLAMCSFSGLMAVRILRKADPVDLFN